MKLACKPFRAVHTFVVTFARAPVHPILPSSHLSVYLPVFETLMRHFVRATSLVTTTPHQPACSKLLCHSCAIPQGAQKPVCISRQTDDPGMWKSASD